MIGHARWVWFWRAVTLGLAGCIAFLSLSPAPPAPPGTDDFFGWVAAMFLRGPEDADKVSHFCAYAALAGAAVMGLGDGGRKRLLYLVAGLVAFGGALEVGQGLGGIRQAEGLDLLANAFGIATGAGASLILRRGMRQMAAQQPQG